MFLRISSINRRNHLWKRVLFSAWNHLEILPHHWSRSIPIAPRNAFPMKTVAVDSESIVPAFASGILRLMRLVFEQIVKPNEMDGMCCTKMPQSAKFILQTGWAFQYMWIWQQISTDWLIDMVGRKPMELVGFKKCLKRIKAWHSLVDFYQHSTNRELNSSKHQGWMVKWSPKGYSLIFFHSPFLVT